MVAIYQTQHILLTASSARVNLGDIALHVPNRYALAARPARRLLIINLDVGIVYAILETALCAPGRPHAVSAIQGISTILPPCFVRR